MPRLKVVEALCSANDEEGISARELHRQLSDAGEPLSLVSVRQVLRRMEENGVTYNVYADPDGADRPWELDLLPNLIPADEWQQIAAGVAQRATLLNRVLRRPAPVQRQGKVVSLPTAARPQSL